MHRYSQKVIELCDDSRHVGEFDAEAADVGSATKGTAASGDVIRLQIKVNSSNQIIQACFKAYGGCAIIAVSALIASLLEGKTLAQACTIQAAELMEMLALPTTKRYCALLGEDAIKAAVQDYQAKREKLNGN